MERIDRFFDRFPTRSFQKGEVILQQDEIPTMAYAIRSGVVKLYSIDNTGTERPLVYDIPNEVFPIGWIFGKLDTTSYFYEALTDLTVAIIPRDELMRGMKADPELMFEFCAYYVERHLDLQLRIEGLEQPRASNKILYSLKYLCSRFGHKVNGDKVEIHLPLIQQDIANLLGLTRETAAIELKKLEQRGILTHHHNHYIIASHKLAEAIETL